MIVYCHVIDKQPLSRVTNSTDVNRRNNLFNMKRLRTIPVVICYDDFLSNQSDYPVINIRSWLDEDINGPVNIRSFREPLKQVCSIYALYHKRNIIELYFYLLSPTRTLD